MTKTGIGETSSTWQGNIGRYLTDREREQLRRANEREQHEHQVGTALERLNLVKSAGINPEDFVSATPVSRAGRLTAGIRFDLVVPATTYHFEGKDTLFNGWVDQVRVVTGRYLGTRAISGYRIGQMDSVITLDGEVGGLVGRDKDGTRQFGRDAIHISSFEHSLDVPYLTTVWGPSLANVSELSIGQMAAVNATLQSLLEPVNSEL